MSERERLPNRREAETFDIEAAGLKYRATIGRFDNGRLAEVFLTDAKAGSTAGIMASDSALLCSIALQHGVPVDVLRRALMRDLAGQSDRTARHCVGHRGKRREPGRGGAPCMTRRAATADLAGHAPAVGDQKVIAFPRQERPPSDGRGAGPGNGRRRAQRRGAGIVPWPHAYRPRQIGRIDFAVALAWQQHANRLIDDIEAHARLEELRALRETLARTREMRGAE